MRESVHEQKLLFLETTIQIERVIGEQRRRNIIRHNTSDRPLCTSGHVQAEFNRTVIRDAITFLDLVRSSPTVEDAVKRFKRYPRHRPFDRAVDIFATLGFEHDRQITIYRLLEFIEWKAYDVFWESIDESYCTDEVQCAHRYWKAEQDEAGEYGIDGLKCLKASPPSCSVQDFIQRNTSALCHFVRDARQSTRTNVAEAGKVLDAIVQGRDQPFGVQNCSTISDTLIVLEAHPRAKIYSTDGDIHAICDILGRLRYSEEETEA